MTPDLDFKITISFSVKTVQDKVRHNYRTPYNFKRHNLGFIYMKISDSIAEGMLSLQI